MDLNRPTAADRTAIHRRAFLLASAATLLLALLPIVLLARLAAAAPSGADGLAGLDATITVNSLDQEVNSDADCSLQEAIFAANFDVNEAVDPGNLAFCQPFDQRGLMRPQLVGCDIGAYEFFLPPTQPPTAATVTDFRAAVDPSGRVVITWVTASEAGTLGFNLLRASAAGGAFTAVNRALIPAIGDAASGAGYRWVDAPGVGAYRYRLEVVNAAPTAPQSFGSAEVVVRALQVFVPWVGRE